MNEKKCDNCPIGNYIQSKFYDVEGNDAQCHFCKGEWFTEKMIVFDCLKCPKNDLNVSDHNKCPIFIEKKCFNKSEFESNINKYIKAILTVK